MHLCLFNLMGSIVLRLTACTENVNYGTSCVKKCAYRNCASSSASCDVQTGSCGIDGCTAGWRGVDCTQSNQ